MTNESFARRRLAECCHLLYDRHLTVSAGGNMSVRLGEDEILITPSGVNKGLINGDDLVKMDMDGNVISGGKPSIEHKFHISIYKENPETNAVIHCHPLYCLALAVKGEDIKSCLTPEGVLLLDQVPTVRYETPGSQELVDAVMEYADAPAMLMAKHHPRQDAGGGIQSDGGTRVPGTPADPGGGCRRTSRGRSGQTQGDEMTWPYW